MSRVIKFRGWHEDYKDMVYFGLGENHFSLMKDNDFYSGIQIEDLIVMQFIGIYDKNGEEIYEGDLVEHLITGIPEEIYKIKKVHFDGGVFKLGNNILGWISPLCLEIIGNIHANPELMEGEDE